MTLRSLALPALLLSLAAAAQAQVTVTAPWVRATVAQQKATGAFMQLKSPKAVKLVSVSSPVAGVAEVHEMAMDGEVMRMRAVQALDLPAGQSVELKPGSFHLMLMSLKGPVKEGDSVPLTLVFESADQTRETVQVNAPARALGSGATSKAPVKAPTKMPPDHGHEGHGAHEHKH